MNHESVSGQIDLSAALILFQLPLIKRCRHAQAMAQLKDKIKTTLDEGRMLILGSQVLIGLQFRSTLEPGFERLPQHAQYLKLGGLGLMLCAIALLMSSGAYHQIVEDGEDTHELHHYATFVMCLALLPFALGLGIDVFVAVEFVIGRTQACVAGIGTSLVALFFWYGLELTQRSEHALAMKEKAMAEQAEAPPGRTELKAKIEQVLTEIRVVLPGAQALLGFQFISVLMDGFEKLPRSSHYIHLASLGLIALSIILMMTPPAYHRLVERGEETEHFCRFASRMLLAAMLPLALGITGDFFVVARKITESKTMAAILAALTLMLFYGLWFGYTFYLRGRRGGPHGSGRQATPNAEPV